MMDDVVIKDLDKLVSITTSHGVGSKKVLLGNDETDTPITQFAVTTIYAGEKAAAHTHIDMAEIFYFQTGKGVLSLDGKEYPVFPGRFVFIPNDVSHELVALSDMQFVTMGLNI